MNSGKCVPAESYWTTRADGAVRLRMEESGPLSLPPETVVDMFERTVRRFPDQVALAVKRGRGWKKWTYREYYQDCRTAAKALIKLGLEEFHGVGIIGFNYPEWIISYQGAIMAGGIGTGLQTSFLSEELHYITRDCSANVIVVEDNVQLQKILQVWGRLPSLKAVVQYFGQPQEKCDNVYSWSEFMALGLQVPDTVLDKRIQLLAPNKCCLLYYTSKNGKPTGLMSSHDQFVWLCKICKSYLEMDEGQEVFLNHFELSETLAVFFDIYFSILLAGTTHFARPDDLKDLDSALGIMREVRPTIFFGTPEIWENIYEDLKTESGINPKLLSWAKKIGYKGNVNRMAGAPLPPGWEVANRLVFQKILKKLGQDRCKISWTCGAPFRRELFDYFMSINILVLDIYGMSEMVGPSNVNIEKCFRIGAVGKSLPGMKIKILNPDKQGSGEVCHYGRHIFMGYLNSKNNTLEILDDQGYLHSGDLGRIDKDGFLFLTGRIKELIITSDGINIEPAPIEDIVKKDIPLLSNCILVGEGKRFLSLLLTLKVQVDSESGKPTGKLTDEAIKLCQALGSKAVTVQEAKRDEILTRAIQCGIEHYNQKTAYKPNKIQNWVILDTDFSISGGELGPTLKLKRSVITKKYDHLIEQMYSPVKVPAKY